MKIEFSGQIFEKYLYFIKILLVGFFPCGRTDRRSDTRTVRQTDMTKLIVAFRNFSNNLKNDEGFTDALSFVFYAILR
jgi:hypothetical protein